jgi:hypothetical protein
MIMLWFTLIALSFYICFLFVSLFNVISVQVIEVAN